MNIALDTNAYSDFFRGVMSRVAVIRSATRIHVPLIVLGELRAGFASAHRETENLTTLESFLSRPRVSVPRPDEETTEHCAKIFRGSEKSAWRSRQTIRLHSFRA